MTTETESRTHARHAIVEAAARLLAEGGIDAVTTRGVAHAAGVQAPTIYRIFGDKGGLIDAVAEHVMAAYVATKAGAAGSEAEASSDPVAALHDGWRQHVEFGLTHPTLFVVLADPLRPSAAAADGDDILRARIRRVAAAGLLRVSEDRAVALVHAAGTGVILTLLSQPPERRAAEDLADTAWDAVAGSILAARPAPRPDDAVSVTVAFRTIAPTLPGLSVAERGVLCEWLDRAIEQGTFPRG